MVLTVRVVAFVVGFQTSDVWLVLFLYFACMFSFFFFFQAEDGIRDVAVTGVQTCALPIFAAVDRSGGGGADRVGAREEEPAGGVANAHAGGPRRVPVHAARGGGEARADRPRRARSRSAARRRRGGRRRRLPRRRRDPAIARRRQGTDDRCRRLGRRRDRRRRRARQLPDRRGGGRTRRGHADRGQAGRALVDAPRRGAARRAAGCGRRGRGRGRARRRRRRGGRIA